MNKIVRTIRMNTPEDIRSSMECILNQLERNKVAITHDFKTVKLFWRFIPDYYKRDERIILARKCGGETKNLIVIKPDYQLVRKDKYSFKISLSNGNFE